MSPHHRRLRVALAALALCSAGLVNATPISQFAADWNASGSIPANSLSQAERDRFLGPQSVQPGYQSEGFSNLGLSALTQDPFAVTQWGGAAQTLWTNGSLTPSDYTDVNTKLTSNRYDANQVDQGRFDTTGPDASGNPSWWFETDKSFTVDLGGAYSAFGFYITDAADWGGSLSLELTAQDGSKSTLSVLDATNTPGQGTSNGGLAFFDFTDQTTKYTSVKFILTQAPNSNAASPDVFGFDDLVVGDVVQQQQQTVPEPASIALAGLALLGAVATRRKPTNA